jgi:hypothetical protein
MCFIGYLFYLSCPCISVPVFNVPPRIKCVAILMTLSCIWLKMKFKLWNVGHLFSFYSVALHRASLISCLLSFSLTCNSSMSCGLQWLLSKMSIQLCTRLMQYMTQCSLNMMGIQICKKIKCYNISDQWNMALFQWVRLLCNKIMLYLMYTTWERLIRDATARKSRQRRVARRISD